MTAVRELHFYPKNHALVVFDITAKGKVPVHRVDARGGPAAVGSDPRMAEIPTTAGTYVVEKIHAYRTPSWKFSQIKWGTKLRDMPKQNDVWYQLPSGSWASAKNNYAITRDEVRQQHFEYYGTLVVPPVWVFNDFGPIAVRYFVDRNGNRKLDGTEKLMGEMIHTTPDNEAQSAQGQPVVLTDSHGCVHVKPSDRDHLLRLGVFKRGTTFVVHTYSESYP